MLGVDEDPSIPCCVVLLHYAVSTDSCLVLMVSRYCCHWCRVVILYLTVDIQFLMSLLCYVVGGDAQVVGRRVYFDSCPESTHLLLRIHWPVHCCMHSAQCGAVSSLNTKCCLSPWVVCTSTP